MPSTKILFPPGRIVAGELYEGSKTDAENRPLVYKTGPNTGQPRIDYYFAVAIPKQPGHTHWAQTEWGALIWNAGHAAFPQAAQSSKFAWKVKDGDSTEPNTKGKRPCDREGFKGCWVVSFSSSFAPRIFNRDGSAPMPDKGAVNPGDWVQVFGDVDGNGSTQQPGMFINHSMVAFQGFGERITYGPDASAVGFGQAALPAGVSATPPAGMVAAPVTPPVAVPPAAVAPPVAVPPPAAPVAAPVPVTPNPALLAAAGAAPLPPGPPAAPAAPVPATPASRMTAKAAGATYESFIKQGWNDDLLIQHGYMTAI